MNTIDLLATIGSDATLRHASPDILAAALEKFQASDALLNAVATGDIAQLGAASGRKNVQAIQSVQWVGDGDETNGPH